MIKNSTLLLYLFSLAVAQTLDVTFRYIQSPGEEFVRVFVPGTMPSDDADDWGPNSGGVISPTAPSQLIYDENIQAFKRTYSLDIGELHYYKFHFHFNESGSSGQWIPDPLNPEITTDGWENSILNVSDPLFFQSVRHLDANEMVDGMSVGIFTQDSVESITYIVSNDTLDGLTHINEDNIFYVELSPPIQIFEAFQIKTVINGIEYIILDYPSITVIEEPLPEGLRQGPNFVNGEMVLVVFAPSQPVMQVIITEPDETGSASNAIVMKKATDEEDIWWIDLDLPNGSYEYEYLLMNGVRLPDPLTRRLINGKTRIEIGSGGISTADDYTWQSNNFVRPNLDTLIIYEMHIDDFSANGSGFGSFQSVVAKLDYLKSVGINAIELMPVTEFPGNMSWGYNPELMSAVEASYGTPEEFKILIDEAHQRGIAIILDLVWNHATSSTPLWKIQPNTNLNPYFKNSNDLNPNETEGTWGMLDFDHFNEKTIEYINEVHRIWLEEYRIDGFRFDATRYVGWDFNVPQYGLIAWTNAIYEMDSTVYQIAEHLPSDPWLVENTMLTSSWHDSFHDKLKDHIFSSLASSSAMHQIIGLHEYSNNGTPYSNRTQAVKYMVSHDEQSLIQEMVAFHGEPLSNAREIDKFYATLLFTAQGIPMIWQGQEIGFQSGWLDDNGNGNWDEEKLGYRPMDWSLLNTEEGQSHLDYYSKLAKLRTENPAFSKGTFYELENYTTERVIVYGYKDESSNNNNDQVIVIANFSSLERTIQNIPFLSTGNWYNVFEPENDIFLENDYYPEYTMSPNSAIIFTNYEWQLTVKPEPLPKEFLTLKSFPNPFNGKIQFQLEGKIQNDGLIDIYDVMGRKVKSIGLNQNITGKTSFNWDGKSENGSQLSSGLYIVRVKTQTQLISQKILYLK